MNDTNGNADEFWNPDVNNTVYCAAINGANFFAGGNFTSVGGCSRNHIVKLDKITGEVDSSWDVNVNDRVTGIGMSGNILLVGGYFTTINGESRPYLAVFEDETLPVENESNIPTEFTLFQNYPNPFNPSTTISYQVPFVSYFSLKVYDVLGREIKTLVGEEKPADNTKLHSMVQVCQVGFTFIG